MNTTPSPGRAPLSARRSISVTPMASVFDKIFSPFEGTRDPRPPALFRIVFYGAVALHFFPALILPAEFSSAHVFRSQEWNRWLHEAFPPMFHWDVRSAAYAAMIACLMGATG